MVDTVGLWVIVYSCVTSVKTKDGNVSMAELSFDQKGIENVLNLIDYSAEPRSDSDLIFRRASSEAFRRWMHTI